MKFVHLHVHSHYSLLDGLSKIDELVERAKEEGAPALALTDHGVMYGAIEFYQKCKKAGIKPIIGVEAYLSPGSRFDKNTRSDEKNYHLILLAKNQTGYRNLIKLTSLAHLEGYYYKPRIDWETLKEHSEGVIAMSACIAGEIARLIISGKEDKARKRIIEYQELFGKEDFYLEIQHHPNLVHQDEVNKKLIQLSRELGASLVVTNDSHYLNKEDDEAQDVLICLQTKKKKNDRDRMSMVGEDYSLRAAGIMAEVFKDAPEAIENTVKIAEKCNLEIEFGQIHLPHFKVPNGYDGGSFLRKLCEDGLAKRYGKNYNEVEPEIKERMDYELSVIDKMGWPSYFLIVADFVNWAKNSGIVVGPGRGSAAGSLVSYLAGITNLDPLKYDLLFERFLNPDRISMPDIDLDFADIRRDEVIRYVEEKYGKDHVAQIITFGTMAARAAVRDVGRVLDAPYDYCDKLAKMIPMFTKINKALEIVEEFKNIYEKEEMARQIINFAKRLEGVARHASTHACGVLITKNPLTDYVPIQYASSSDKTIVSQYSLHPVEDLGLLKMDFLGLKNLTIIESALKIIKNTRGLEINIDKIPLDNEKAYKLFQDGETTGVFQFECLSGDTTVSNTTIKKLFEKKHKEKLLSVYINDGKVHKNNILKVVQSGEKELYNLIAENDWHIKATKEHKFLTDNGWKKLGDLKIGDKILVKLKAKHFIYNICACCGKQISGQKEGKSEFCYVCSVKHYSNPSKQESRKKIKEARIKFFKNGGKPWNLGLNIENSDIVKLTGQKISESLCGKTFEHFYGKEEAEKKKAALSKRFSGAGNPMFGKPSPHRRGGYRDDLGHYVRSAWEADFARILKLHNLAYQYEPKTFELKKQNGEIIHYTPDFYTESDNTFYEIKGWMHDLDKEKIDLFQEQFSQYNFILVSSTKFSEFALKYKKLIKWECPKIPESFRYVKVKKIVYAGKEMTYDIAMQSPGNNFIANGFVVHNSSGMKRYLRELKSTEFEDIIAMVALYRPGPMEWIPDYIAGKHGKKTQYLHLALEPILKKTYGVAIYQEQVMQMARTLAGFTMGEADVLRKAMGKKIPKLLAEQKEKFISGCVKNNIAKKLAETIFSFIEPFAGYGFNRSHAACYAMVAYQTAYLKANWPTEFMAALLTSDQENTDRVAIEIEESRALGIEVLPPDINQSFDSFTVVTSGTALNKVVDEDEKVNTIRFGLKAIKNVGGHIAEAIIKERKKNGPYKDISDFLERVNDKDLNKKSLESLVKSGSLELFGDRGYLLSNMESLLSFTKEINQNRNNGQTSLFANAPILKIENKVKLASAPPASRQEKLAWEKELLGLYITEHPFSDYKKYLSGIAVPLRATAQQSKNVQIRVAGIISKIKKIITRSNEAMLFVKIEDQTDNMEILVFPSILKETAAVWQEGKVVLCEGKLSDKDQEMKLLCNKAVELTLETVEKITARYAAAPWNFMRNKPAPIRPAVDNCSLSEGECFCIALAKNYDPLVLNKLKEILEANQGDKKVYFKINSSNIETNFKVNYCETLKQSINNLLNSN